MTDYIALALADQEERENSGTAELLLEQRRTAGTGREKTRERAAEALEEKAGGTALGGSGPAARVRSGAETDGKDARNQNGGLEMLAADRTRARLETTEAAAPAVKWLAGMAAVFRGSASGGELYQRLRQAQTAAEYRPNRTSVALLPAEGQSGAVKGLAELDRAFQRDARRYDGGFEFY